MDPLAWLGLKRTRRRRANLTEIHECVRKLLPNDEPVVLRYIVIVAVLLTRVAQSDGNVLSCEMDHLRLLFQHIDRMPPEGVDELCATLNDRVPLLTEEELRLCFRELKSLCNAKERLQVMRLLASQATSDGSVAPSEHSTLVEIADGLDVPTELIEDIEIEALSSEAPPIAMHADAGPRPAK
jgi:DnaJ like chaperone protein